MKVATCERKRAHCERAREHIVRKERGRLVEYIMRERGKIRYHERRGESGERTP